MDEEKRFEELLGSYSEKAKDMLSEEGKVEEILKKALSKTHLRNLFHSQVPTTCGDILKIDSHGNITQETFDDSRLFSFWSDPFQKPFCYHSMRSTSTVEMDYLKAVLV